MKPAAHQGVLNRHPLDCKLHQAGPQNGLEFMEFVCVFVIRSIVYVF
jgi:hypothetical protein